MKPRLSRIIILGFLIVIATVWAMVVIIQGERYSALALESPLSISRLSPVATPLSRVPLTFLSPLGRPSRVQPSPEANSVLKKQQEPSRTFLSFTPSYTSYLPLVFKKYPLWLAQIKGTAGKDPYGLLQNVDAYYDWGIGPQATATNKDPGRVRMVSCPRAKFYNEENGAYQITVTAKSDYANSVMNRVWLIWNEPDNSWVPLENPAGGQCGSWYLEGTTKVYQAPERAAYYYTKTYNLIKAADPNAKVFPGGMLDIQPGRIGWDWWARFYTTLVQTGYKYTIDGMHLHGYPHWSVDCGTVGYSHCHPTMTLRLNNWYNTWWANEGLADKPIWITELGGGAWSKPERYKNTDDMNRSLDVMRYYWQWFTKDPAYMTTFPNAAVNPGYDALFWFVPKDTVDWWATSLYYYDPAPHDKDKTPLGTTWDSCIAP